MARLATSDAAALPGARGASARWLTGPVIDLVIGCGAWTLPLLAATYWLSTRTRLDVALAFYWLMVLCNNPHYMATIYRAYGRYEDFARYRVFTVYATALLALCVVGSHWSARLLPWLVTAYLTWSPWHYTGQNFGIAMLLARRSGATPTNTDRTALSVAFAASYLMWALWLHSAYSDDPHVLTLGIPLEIAATLRLALIGVFFTTGVYGLVRLVRQTNVSAMSGPLVVFTTQFLWFVFPSLLEFGAHVRLPPAYYSGGVLAFMHCAQYLWVTSFYARREAEAGTPRGAAAWNAWRYYFILLVGGIALFISGPWLVSSALHFELTDSVLIFAAVVNLHHFIIDGAVWKLRDGKIAALLLSTSRPATRRSRRANANEHADNGNHRWTGWFVGSARGARLLRWSVVASLITVASLDQVQYFLTREQTDVSKLALAQELNPHDARVPVRRAQMLTSQGQTAEAMAELRRALALNPRNASALRMLGSLLVETGQYEQAAAHYAVVEQQIPADLSTLINVAVLAARAGDSRRAEDRLLQALRIDPAHLEGQLNLAEVYMARGDFAQAVPHYRAYLALAAPEVGSSPNRGHLFVVVLLKLGQADAASGQLDDARSAFEQARSVAVQHGDADAVREAEQQLARLTTRQ
jgi:tetratricopeptide (TPR) repeat protein